MSTTTDSGVEPTTGPTPGTGAPTYPLRARLAAEAFGTLWLVLGGVGAAVLAGDQIGNAGIAAAFGLSVLTAAYAVGHVSGGPTSTPPSRSAWPSRAGSPGARCRRTS